MRRLRLYRSALFLTMLRYSSSPYCLSAHVILTQRNKQATRFTHRCRRAWPPWTTTPSVAAAMASVSGEGSSHRSSMSVLSAPSAQTAPTQHRLSNVFDVRLLLLQKYQQNMRMNSPRLGLTQAHALAVMTTHTASCLQAHACLTHLGPVALAMSATSEVLAMKLLSIGLMRFQQAGRAGVH